MAANPSYVRHYDVPLLDAIHNYFPDILYAPPERFQTVPQLLQYIRDQVRARFDLFSAGAGEWRTQHPNPHIGSMNIPTPPYNVVPARQRHIPIVNPTVPPHMLSPPTPVSAPSTPPHQPVRIRTTLSEPAQRLLGLSGVEALGTIRSAARGTGGLASSSLLDLITAAFIPTPLDPFLELPLPNLDPVIVHPSAEQIAENTTIEIVDAEEEVCAICQDEMAAGTEARNLNACDHRFHVGCIDTWFQQNVHCPVCRHDVREPAAGED